jgi:organic radical activating enzyme
MDIQKFYDKTNAGERVDPKEVLDYITGFDKVVLWGASWLGKSVGSFLLTEGLDFEEYWDLRAAEIGNMNGKTVNLPFSTEYERDNTLIIYCISNKVIYRSIEKALYDNNYTNFLAGFNLFMVKLCPSDLKCGLDLDFCSKSRSCLKIYCQRLASLFKHEHTDKNQECPINLNGVTLIINQICNLSCKHCTSYMNAYKQSDRINFSTENINRDINNFFSSVDSVASMTVMGGEPFMHPDISDIISSVLKYDNIGYISISTNGVYPIKPGQLPGLKDKRLVVAFNNYLPNLPDNLRVIFDKNVELVKSSGANYSVGNYMPNWRIPSTLYKLDRSVEEIKKWRQDCKTEEDTLLGPIHRQIKNGKLYPCDFSNALHSLRVADYPDDYVDLTDINGLRKRLYQHYYSEFYFTCGHCRLCSVPAGGAALQGKLDFITLPQNVDPKAYVPT